MRFVSIAPLLIPHQATEDGELGQYLIPKGTQVYIHAVQNIYNKNQNNIFVEIRSTLISNLISNQSFQLRDILEAFLLIDLVQCLGIEPWPKILGGTLDF